MTAFCCTITTSVRQNPPQRRCTLPNAREFGDQTSTALREAAAVRQRNESRATVQGSFGNARVKQGVPRGEMDDAALDCAAASAASTVQEFRHEDTRS